VGALREQVAQLQRALLLVQGGQLERQCEQLVMARGVLRERVAALEEQLEQRLADADASEADASDAEDDAGDAPSQRSDGRPSEDALREELARVNLQLHIAEDELFQRQQHLRCQDDAAGEGENEDTSAYVPFGDEFEPVS
jgi:chromosome segregation ATPase